MSFDEAKPITSRSWVQAYKTEFGEPPAVMSGAVFAEGGVDVAVPIPSIDPLRLFSSSRVSTLNASRLASLDSEWFQNAMSSRTALQSTHISTRDLVTKTFLGDTEPPLHPEHADEHAFEPVTLPPAAREYVDMVTENDVLSERGGKANHHQGNKRYRKVVSEMKAQYRLTAAKTAKTDLAKSILEYVDNYGGRFLKKDKAGRYFVMTKTEARKKTSQALRETKQLKWTDVDVDVEEGS